MLAKDEDGFVYDVPAHMIGQKDRIEDAAPWVFYGLIVVGNLVLLGQILWMAVT